jgi:PLD-like domain
MKFLDGADATALIKELVCKSGAVRLAVAFWGVPAAENLGLLRKGKAANVICNLKMGGTNPKEIRALKDSGVRVSQCDTLHGKVYLFDHSLIVGSSNASANGLSLQGEELSGWHEANLYSDNQDVYDAASRWFNDLPTKDITDEDLYAAQDAWSRQRRSAIPNWLKDHPLAKNKTLVEVLRENPEAFTGERIYVCAYSVQMSPDGNRAVEKAQREMGANYDGFQDWPELPDRADLVCFYLPPGRRIRFEGFCAMPEPRQEFKYRNTTIQLCLIKHDIRGMLNKGPLNEWTPALRRFAEENFNDDGRAFMDLGEFSETYLIRNQ